MKQKSNNTGTEFCDAVATYISSLAQKRDCAGVVRYYEAHRSLIDDAGGSWAGAILLKVSDAWASLTDYPAALKTARVAQAKAAEDGDSVLLAEIFVTLGGILRDMGQVKEAQKAFQDAESIFRRNDCLEGQSRALNLLAGLYFRQADYRSALRVLMDAVEIARKLDDKQKLAFMMGNIGRVYTFMGDLAEAEKHLTINVDLSTELRDELEVARAYLSLGYIHIQQAAYDKAERALAQAYPRIITAASRRDEVIYMTYLGELRYRTGRNEESGAVLEKALVMAEGIAPGTTLVGRVLRHLAELNLRLDNYRLVRKFAAQSMVIMEKTSNKVETGALLRIKAQVAQAHGHKKDAVRLYKKAIDVLDESGVRFERAEALVAAGKCELFGQRQRMTYLFRAEEYYSRCRMTQRLDKVSRLISSLGCTKAGPVTPTRTGTTGGVDFLTASPVIQRFKAQLPMFGHSDLPLMLTGETGVGKDHLARYFHSLVRPGGPFVAINCASVPETLLESELFGYSRGAFTGADASKCGLFVAANGGVLMLDEIGDMPLKLQAKLLGVLERRKVIPLGSTTEVALDVILVAATNKNLEAMVEDGTFRRDLYYRLSGITFRIPPLRERREDIALLLKHFLVEHDLLPEDLAPPAELVRLFLAYDWPGNIRELDNKVKRLQVMSQMVAEGDLVELYRSLFPQSADLDESSDGESLFQRVEQFERKLITEALLAARGNKSEAARLLGVHEATVRTKLKRYGISVPPTVLRGGAPS
ncbi:MAG TPA: sigma 54-interacting transcriptional regulator [Acidobacteriota bacterium]|nr:sigma 54-interacting transcriptional regulator [Acidobacteriota bacterium]